MYIHPPHSLKQPQPLFQQALGTQITYVLESNSYGNGFTFDW
jgi:hypothetical protein